MNTAWQLNRLCLPKSSGEVSFIKQITYWAEPLSLASAKSFGRQPAERMHTQEPPANGI